MPVNEFGQSVGVPLPEWVPREPVEPVPLEGRTCRVEPLHARHVDALYAATVEQSPPETWTYMPAGPFASHGEFLGYLRTLHGTPGTVPFALLDADGRPQGIACYLRIDPVNGTIEVGSITYSAAMRRTTMATEAMYLMARHAIEDLGFRRYEWKCDALNAPSRAAALRLGFTYEGTFRQAIVTKGRNRDTAWFSITDAEWRALRPAYDVWLAPANFGADGRQRRTLAEIVAASG